MQRRRAVRLAVLACSLVVATIVLPQSAQVVAIECLDVDALTLSSQCELCSTNRFCYTKESSCKCLAVGSPTFSLLIPFSKTRVVPAGLSTVSDIVEGPDDTAKTPWVSNEDVNKIGQLTLPETTTIVYVAGCCLCEGDTSFLLADDLSLPCLLQHHPRRQQSVGDLQGRRRGRQVLQRLPGRPDASHAGLPRQPRPTCVRQPRGSDAAVQRRYSRAQQRSPPSDS